MSLYNNIWCDRGVYLESKNKARLVMIHPIIIYPYKDPSDKKHLGRLYEWLNDLKQEFPSDYYRPITVISGDTEYRNTKWANDKAKEEDYKNFRKDTVEANSEIIVSWNVDTCQRWLCGFGRAIEEKSKNVHDQDVYWLIPGDFDYASDNGEAMLTEMSQLPLQVYEGQCDLCLGEITVPFNSSKQLIDTYGTYGLLYNWFPAEAQGIREKTGKPRTEFFAINDSYLTVCLQHRWYAYEQTIAILLRGMEGREQSRIIRNKKLGKGTDDPASREHLSDAMQQVERMERMLKQFWREQQISYGSRTWVEDFRRLDLQSEQIRAAALVILQQILIN